LPNIQQQEQVQAWIKKLDLVDPPPQVIKAITVRIESICLLRKEQHELVIKLAELIKVSTKQLYVFLQQKDRTWTPDLTEEDLKKRIEYLEDNIFYCEDSLDQQEGNGEPLREPDATLEHGKIVCFTIY